MHIVCLHGLGAHPITFAPMVLFLKMYNIQNIHNLYYPVDTMNLQESLDYVDLEMQKYISKKDEEVIIIGQSFGGVLAINLHTKGWKIRGSISIFSPLHGARLLKQIEEVIPINIRDALYKRPYDSLKDGRVQEPPPHSYRTISTGWFCSSFDGCVYKDETILEEENHIHLPFGDHRTMFMNPRLMKVVKEQIESF